MKASLWYMVKWGNLDTEVGIYVKYVDKDGFVWGWGPSDDPEFVSFEDVYSYRVATKEEANRAEQMTPYK